MKTGALIFAFNNEHIDYVSLAAWSAARIRRWLDIPVCCVTDSDQRHDMFDHVIQIPRPEAVGRWFGDFDTDAFWYNRERCRAFDLTPWDRTLLLDADYVVNSDMLKPLIVSDVDFACHKRCHDVIGSNRLDDSQYFGRNRMPMWWATVMLFSRGIRSQVIFECMSMIQQNWEHYRKLYAIGQRTFRNDIALSIAIAIESGHTLRGNDIPWPLAAVLSDHKLTRTDTDTFRVDYQDHTQRRRYMNLHEVDFHALNKRDLGAIIAAQ